MLRIGVLSLQQLLFHLHGRVEILLTRIFLIRGEIAAYFTSWNPPFVIDMSVPSQEMYQPCICVLKVPVMYMCVKGTSNVYVC